MLRREEHHQREARAGEGREVKEPHAGHQGQAARQRDRQQRVAVVGLGRERERQQHRADHRRQEARTEAREAAAGPREQPADREHQEEARRLDRLELLPAEADPP